MCSYKQIPVVKTGVLFIDSILKEKKTVNIELFLNLITKKNQFKTPYYRRTLWYYAKYIFFLKNNRQPIHLKKYTTTWDKIQVTNPL